MVPHYLLLANSVVFYLGGNMYNKEELLKIQDDYERALSLIKVLFEDITDKEGKPYINHLIRVSNNLENKNTKTAGLLHDVIEVLYEELLKLLNLICKHQLLIVYLKCLL